MEGAEFGEDFGQRVDLTQRIREVLANYPEGTTILKELLQNADDARATKVAFCLDRRQHGVSSLAYEPLAQFQGPALLVYNNGVFTEEDFESISRVGDSKKRAQAWKTGRFGIGFNSVYHLSDLPSFVSGSNAVFFDPHCRYLPRVSSANPGKRVDFVKSPALKSFPDQFSPFVAFGCTMEEPFQGTLFRFPLRTAGQAEHSQLSRQAFMPRDVASLLGSFEEEAVTSLLFLKHVEVIETYVWAADGPAPHKSFTCKVENPSPPLRAHRQLFSKLALSLPPGTTDYTDVHSIQFLSQWEQSVDDKSLNPSVKGRVCEQTFLVSQSMAATNSRIGTMAKNAARDYDLHLVPWASIAADISNADARGDKFTAMAGQAFCFLPLPLKTGLPVHVNGYFELSSNRRDIWYGDDMDRSGRLRSDWNRGLLCDVAAPAYRQLLVEAYKFFGGSASFYELFPSAHYVEPWLGLVSSLYRNLSAVPILYSKLGHQVSPLEAIFHDEEFQNPDEFENVLVHENLPLVRIPKAVKQFVFTFSVQMPKIMSPSFLRKHLTSPGSHPTLDVQNSKARLSSAMLMLEYCLDDVIDEEAAEIMCGLKLIPLASGNLGVFSLRVAGSEIVFPASELEYSLLLEGGASHRMVGVKSVNKMLLERLKNISHLSTGCNLSPLNVESLLNLFPLFFPAGWRFKDEVAWQGVNKAQQKPSELWLQCFWEYISLQNIDLQSFSEWPILPVTGGQLCRAVKTGSTILQGEGWDAVVFTLLLKLGCKFVRHEILPTGLAITKGYVHSCSAIGVLEALSLLLKSKVTPVLNLLEAATAEEKRALRTFLYTTTDISSTTNPLSEKRVRTFRALPIFEANSRSDIDKVSFTSLAGPSAKFLAPEGIDKEVLGPDFLITKSQREIDVLTTILGIQRLGRSSFYKLQVLSRLQDLPAAVRDKMMLTILRELPQLSAQDRSIREALIQLPFIPTADGSLKRANSLYNPQNVELKELLQDDQDWFPVGEFAHPDVLNMLLGLGLKTAVTQQTVLESARAIELLLGNDPDASRARGKILLAYMDMNAARWLPPTGPAENSLQGMLSKVSTLFQGSEMSAADSRLDHVALARKFWAELGSICWCPVLVEPPLANIPWVQSTTPVAPPRLVRPANDIWLTSASMRTLDGECRSTVLATQLGWAQPPGTQP